MEGTVVVVDHLLEGGEPAVMHVGRGQGDVPQGWNLELSAIRGGRRDPLPADVSGAFLQPVVAKLMIAEEVAAVTMETVGAAQPAGRVVFRDEQLQAALFLRGQGRE